MSKQARILTDRQFDIAYRQCQCDRERAFLLLSVKAGLRAKEIAGLEWRHVDLRHGMLRLEVTKGNKFREVPMHPLLEEILGKLHSMTTDTVVFRNTHAAPGRQLTAAAVTVWFQRFYRDRLGWEGYSSHSGRRTFVTKVARSIVTAGGSMKDVQQLAGHSDIRTTGGYIETDPDAQRKVIKLI